jgi:rubrerythrin
MPTMTTKLTGGRGALMTPVSFSPPECAMAAEQLESFLAGTGLNGRFMADLLSACLMHEQCGLHLYRTAVSMTDTPQLKARYEEFGRETEEHIRIFEELITACGGQPGYVSPMARLTEALDTKIHESAIALPDGADQAAFELAILEAVVLAETKCHADWSLIQQMTAALPQGEARSAFQRAVDEVEQQEDEHIRWAKQAWEEMILSQAKAPSGAG